MPRVSVIVPTHQRAALLAEALESVAQQTYRDLECIVVSDGPDAATESLVKDLAARDARFRILVISHGGSPGRTRNAGIRECRGELVAFLDDDDRWVPEKLGEQVALLDQEPDTAMCCTLVQEIEDRDGVWPRGWKPGVIDLKGLARRNIVCTSTVVVRREVLHAAEGFDETLHWAQDYDLWLRIARHRRIRLIDRVLALRRHHAANHSNDRAASLARVVWIARRLHHEGTLSNRVMRHRLRRIYAERAQISPRPGGRWFWRARRALIRLRYPG